MSGNRINMVVGPQFSWRHTFYGQKWAEMRSAWLLVIVSGDDVLPVAKMEWNQHSCQCSIQETHNLWARMDRNEINMAAGASFRRPRTTCGKKWAEIRSIWLLAPNSANDTLAVDKSGEKSDQYSRRHFQSGDNTLPVGENGNRINVAVDAYLRRQHTSCGRE